MKAELAKEFRAELREFVQQDIVKNSDELDAKRKMPRTSDDMDAVTLRWCDTDPDMDRVRILEALPNESLDSRIHDRLKKLALL